MKSFAACGFAPTYHMTRKSTRRDFLKGTSAGDPLPDEGGKVTADSSGLVRISREAMAGRFEVVLNASQYDRGTEIALDALDLVDELEGQMSAFRLDSELSRLNRSAGRGPVRVEPRLFALFQLAQRLHAETGGAVDVATGRLSAVWGFSRRDGTIPTDEQLAEAMADSGMDQLELDERNETIRFRRPGVLINLGAIGKGYALDRCAESLAAGGLDTFMIQAGTSSVLARGATSPSATSPSATSPSATSPSTTSPSATFPDAAGWVIGLGHPLREGKRLGEIRLRDRALATSGSAKQFFRHQGRRYSHILDPRTGRPAEGVLSATVLAPTAAEADAVSTALFVMGPEAAVEYCRSRPEIAAVLVCPDRAARGIEITSAGFQQDELNLFPSTRS